MPPTSKHDAGAYFLPDEAVHRMCMEGRVGDVVLHIQASLQSGPSTFKTLQFVLGAVLFSKMDDAASLAFVLDCVQHIQGNGSDAPPAVAHLLLELIPSSLPRCSEQLKERALDLFACFCTPSTARVALKLAQAFQLQWASIADQEALLLFMQELLVNKAGMAVGVGLAMHFREVEQHLDCKALLVEVVASGLESLAEKWVALLGREYQVVFIEQCVVYGRLKAASKAVRSFRLQAEFPDVDNLYRERTLGRLLERRQWAVAATFAGVDVHLQTALVKALSMEGEGLLAEEYAKQWKLPLELARPDPAELAAELARRAATYLQLQLPVDSVHFVDTPEGVAAAEAVLRGARVVGLDVEWKPFTEKGAGQAPASILQVATEQHVFIFDLICLSREPSLDACLTALMSSAAVQKLGLELAGDLRKLAGSYPGMRAFQQVQGVVDVRQVWLAVCREVKGQVLGATLKGLSLSKLAQELLGRPLDKSMQVSDWEARPLSARQLAYAAMDAHCLLLMRQRLLALAPNTAPGHFQAAACTFQAGPPLPSAPVDANPNDDEDGDDDDDGTAMTPPTSRCGLDSPVNAAAPSPATAARTPSTLLSPRQARPVAVTDIPAPTTSTLSSSWWSPSASQPRSHSLSTSFPQTPQALPPASPSQPTPPEKVTVAAAAASTTTSTVATTITMDGPHTNQPSSCAEGAGSEAGQASGSWLMVPKAVRRALQAAGLEGALLSLSGLLPDGASVAAPIDVAAALGVPLQRMVKAVAVVVKARRVAVVARGHHRLAPRKAGWLRC